MAFTLVSHLEPQQCLGWCGLLSITAGGLPTAPCFNRAMPERRFPPPWSAEQTDACFIVRDANGQALTSVCRQEKGALECYEWSRPRR